MGYQGYPSLEEYDRANTLKGQDRATFGLAVTAVFFIIIVAFFMCYVVSSLNSLYSKVTSSEKVDETPSTTPAAASYTKPKASSDPVMVSAEDNAEESSLATPNRASLGVRGPMASRDDPRTSALRWVETQVEAAHGAATAVWREERGRTTPKRRPSYLLPSPLTD